MVYIAPSRGFYSTGATRPTVLARKQQGSSANPPANIRFGGRKTNITLGLIGTVLMTALGGSFLAKAYPSDHVPHYDAESPIINGIDMAEVRRKLETEGLTGTLHAAAHDKRQYVFTYRDPKNFFKNVQIALGFRNPAMHRQFKQLERHDAIRIHGYLGRSNAQPHIRVTGLEVLEKWEPQTEASEKFKRSAFDLRQELGDKEEITALVHAVAADGNIVLLEYGSHIIPMKVPDPSFTENLWRDDIIKVRYTLRNKPHNPQHIELNTDTSDGKKPVEVLERIQDLHKKKMTLEGRLVMFPQSPIINRDIWALEYTGPDGLNRYFTLFNFEDAEDMKRVDDKLRDYWNAHPEGVIDARGKLLNTGVRIRATGIVNIVSPSQANPQLTLKSEGIELAR